MYFSHFLWYSEYMPLIIPAGFHQVTFSFTLDESTQVFACTCGGESDTILTAQGLADAWHTAWCTGVSAPWAAGAMPTTLSKTSVRVILQGDVEQTVGENTNPVIGTVGMAQPPANCCQLIVKRTGLAGRKHRGRMFSPMTTDELQVSPTGIISTASVTALQTKWTYALTTIQSAGIDPVILHTQEPGAPAPPLPTPIVELRVSNLVGTLRGRLR